MALTGFSFAVSTSWALERTQTPFASSSESDSVYFALASLDTAVWNQVYVAQLSIATVSSTTIDLTSFTNLVNETVAFDHVLSIFVQPNGADITIAPGASNGLVWFFGGTTPTIAIPNGAVFAYSLPDTSTGQVVDATHKTLLFTNTGLTTTLVDVVILGQT